MNENENELFPKGIEDDYQSIEINRQKLRDKMDLFYMENNQWNISKTNVHNIILIGRSRAGKSTVRKTLIDPMSKSVQLNLYAETKEVDMASLQVDRITDRKYPTEQSDVNANNRFILNIVDTPGLFELNKGVELARDNDQLLLTIRDGLTKIGTSYHYICFCVSVIDGIRKEDIETLDNVLNYFGLAKFVEHICIIITRCEMKTEKQRENLKAELETQLPFVKQLKRGVHFAGCLSHEQWAVGDAASLAFQFKNVMSYRENLLKSFTTPIQPCELKARERMTSNTRGFHPPSTSGSSSEGIPSQSRRPPSTDHKTNTNVSRTAHSTPSLESCSACDKEVHCRAHCPYRHPAGCVVQ